MNLKLSASFFILYENITDLIWFNIRLLASGAATKNRPIVCSLLISSIKNFLDRHKLKKPKWPSNKRLYNALWLVKRAIWMHCIVVCALKVRVKVAAKSKTLQAKQIWKRPIFKRSETGGDGKQITWNGAYKYKYTDSLTNDNRLSHTQPHTHNKTIITSIKWLIFFVFSRS